jgi:hypothetical protein
LTSLGKKGLPERNRGFGQAAPKLVYALAAGGTSSTWASPFGCLLEP